MTGPEQSPPQGPAPGGGTEAPRPHLPPQAPGVPGMPPGRADVTAVPPTPPPPRMAAPPSPPRPAGGVRTTPTKTGYAAIAADKTPERQLGGPRTYEVPERHWPIVAGITAGVVALVGALAFGVWWFALRPDVDGGAAAPVPAASTGTPAASASASETTAAASKSATAATAATAPPAAATGVAVAATKMPARAPLIAYRAEGGVWVCDDGGGDRRRVLSSADGEFALSPDGSRLAVADTATKHLLVADVASAKVTDVGPADDLVPGWAPDGSFVVWTAERGGDQYVMRAGRDGSTAFALTKGKSPQVSLDGRRVLFLAARPGADGGPLQSTSSDLPDKAVVTLVGTDVYAFAEAPGALLCVSGKGKRSIVRAEPNGAGARTLVGPPADVGAYTYASLYVSPDGRSLAYARAGDDGFSRMSVVPVDGSAKPRDLSPRHDDYPRCWTSDGTRIAFISGNAMTGRATDLASIRPDGTNRLVLVTGAGL